MKRVGTIMQAIVILEKISEVACTITEQIIKKQKAGFPTAHGGGSIGNDKSN